VQLKLYAYSHLNAIASSRRLEREAWRNVELMWLTGRLALDRKRSSRHKVTKRAQVFWITDP
jgi:hypothetical protein